MNDNKLNLNTITRLCDEVDVSLDTDPFRTVKKLFRKELDGASDLDKILREVRDELGVPVDELVVEYRNDFIVFGFAEKVEDIPKDEYKLLRARAFKEKLWSEVTKFLKDNSIEFVMNDNETHNPRFDKLLDLYSLDAFESIHAIILEDFLI